MLCVFDGVSGFNLRLLRYGCSLPLQFNAWAMAGVDGGGIGESGDAGCDNGLVLQVSQVVPVVVTVMLLLLMLLLLLLMLMMLLLMLMLLLLMLLLLMPYAFRLRMTP
jgi:hypothetical protein